MPFFWDTAALLAAVPSDDFNALLRFDLRRFCEEIKANWRTAPHEDILRFSSNDRNGGMLTIIGDLPGIDAVAHLQGVGTRAPKPRG